MKPFSLVDRHSSRSRGRDGFIPTENHPLSPPDTEISSQLDPYATPSRRPSLAHPDSIYVLPTIPATPEAPRESAGARFRRLAGIPTTQSGPREFRGASRPQTRWLIVLMPPPQLTNELAVGHRSPGRIANGLLVPLFPTLFAQLTAIAKEFSLPSTTGLCLYLHIPDAPATPRITDDVWPLLWSRHFHTDDSALPLGLPVAGRVEFDIDIPNARWYPMWFAHVSRQELVPDLARTIPPSPRGPGRDLSPNESTRAAKSVPRPLTLVPRDEPVVQVDSTPSPAPSSSRPGIPKSASKETVEKVRRWSALVTPDPALRVDSLPAAPAAVEEISVPPSTDETPVPLSTEASPEDEPLNLEDFQWSISSAGPPSPTSSRATSASSRVVSIHILERNEGSVLLTPTTATSWGAPSVSDVESDLNLNLGWRVRSPDIGERAEGSVLLTPSTATSWGAPLSYPSTPAQWIAMQEFVRSPDLGERAEGSVLLTPSTATTWGAPLSYPPTPAQWYSMQQYIRSPDAGERAEGSVLLTPSTATTWGAPETYPPTPEAWAAAQRGRVASPDLGARAEVESEFGRGRNSTMVWGAEIETEQEAYARMRLPSVWEFGRPRPEGGAPETVAEEPELDGASRGNQGAEGSAPIVFITREVTETFELRSPRFELAADDTSPEGNSTLGDRDSAEFGVLGSDREQGVGVDTFEHGLPHFEPVPLDEEDEILDAAAHDTFEYDLPHFELVEGEGEDEDEGEGEYDGPDAVTPDTFGYPDFELQASDMHVEHSTFVSSPASIATAKSVALETVTVASTTTTAATQARSYGAYPFLVIYPAMYPHLDLYPAALGVTVARSRPTLNSATRAIRTQVTESTVAAANFQTTGAIKRASTPRPVGSTIPVEFVSSPVESIKTVSSQTEPSVPSPSSRRPSLSVRVPRARSGTIVAVNPAAGRSLAWSRALPPVPPVPPEVLARLAGPENARSVNAPVPSRRLNVGRKPPTVLENTEFEPLPSEKKLVLSSAYPYRYPHNLAQLYPPVRTLGYPCNLEVLYPSVAKVPKSVSGVSVLAERPDILLATRPAVQQRVYPLFDLYPAVYPYNLLELYPPIPAPIPTPAQPAHARLTDATVGKQAGSIGQHAPIKKLSDIQVHLSPQYPALDLFPAVYPHNLESIYPAPPRVLAATAPRKNLAQLPAPTIKPAHAVPKPPSVLPPTKKLSEIQVRLSPRYPALELFPAVYPYNLESIYPAPPRVLAATTPRKGLAVSEIQVRLSPRYPALELFPAVYPYNLESIYPALPRVLAATPRKDLSQLQASARSAPTSNASTTGGKRAGSIAVKSLSGIQVRLSPQYPALDLFPPVYPYNLERIYPAPPKALAQMQAAIRPIHAVSKPSAKLPVRLTRVYPNIELYAPVYPFNLDIYPSVQGKNGTAFVNPNLQGRGGSAGLSSDTVVEKEVIKTSSKSRKTHAQLCVEVWRKTHVQLVAEVVKEAAPMRVRKSHNELQAEVFPDGLPEPVTIATAGPQVMITPVPVVTTTPEPEPAPQPAPLRRQRSGTIMMRRPPAPAESTPPLPPLPPALQGADLGRSRSMVEARTQIFERAAPARSQTISTPRLVRGKNASFERARSLFHTPEESDKAASEGSRTPPRISRNVSKLDMSKFKFS